MSNQTKKGGLFRAASILLLINKILMIVSLVLFVLYAIIITAFYAAGILSIGDAQISTISIVVLLVIMGIALVIGTVCQIVMIIIYSIARKKLLKANAKKDYMGWMIACIVLSALSTNILGLVGPILALCVPNSDFETPEDGSGTVENVSVDNTTADF